MLKKLKNPLLVSVIAFTQWVSGADFNTSDMSPLNVVSYSVEYCIKNDLEGSLSSESLVMILGEVKQTHPSMLPSLYRALVVSMPEKINDVLSAVYETDRKNILRLIDIIKTASPDRYLDCLVESSRLGVSTKHIIARASLIENADLSQLSNLLKEKELDPQVDSTRQREELFLISMLNDESQLKDVGRIARSLAGKKSDRITKMISEELTQVAIAENLLQGLVSSQLSFDQLIADGSNRITITRENSGNVRLVIVTPDGSQYEIVLTSDQLLDIPLDVTTKRNYGE